MRVDLETIAWSLAALLEERLPQRVLRAFEIEAYEPAATKTLCWWVALVPLFRSRHIPEVACDATGFSIFGDFGKFVDGVKYEEPEGLERVVELMTQICLECLTKYKD